MGYFQSYSRDGFLCPVMFHITQLLGIYFISKKKICFGDDQSLIVGTSIPSPVAIRWWEYHGLVGFSPPKKYHESSVGMVKLPINMEK